MKTKEIINKPDTEALSDQEMAYVVQEYIKERKGQDVVINIYKNFNQNNPLSTMFLAQEINQLHEAYNTAKYWLLENKYKED